jgi:hypothetical protein
MSLARLMSQPCKIGHVSQTGPLDEYGDPTDVVTHVDSFCYIEQRRAAEKTALADIQTEDWHVMLPADADVTGDDRIAVAELVLEIQGPPWSVENPRLGIVSHIECIARQVATADEVS